MNEPTVKHEVQKTSSDFHMQAEGGKPGKSRFARPGSWKGARDVTAEVAPNKQQANPVARMKRKFAKAGALQLQKWGRRMIRHHDMLLAAAKHWHAGLDKESPLKLSDFPLMHRLIAARTTLEAIGTELAKRSNDKQAELIMSCATQGKELTEQMVDDVADMLNDTVTVKPDEVVCKETSIVKP